MMCSGHYQSPERIRVASGHKEAEWKQTGKPRRPRNLLLCGIHFTVFPYCPIAESFLKVTVGFLHNVGK